MEIITILHGRGKKYWLDKTPYGPLKTTKIAPLKHLIYKRSTCHHKRYLFENLYISHRSSMPDIKIKFCQHLCHLFYDSGSEKLNVSLKNLFGTPYLLLGAPKLINSTELRGFMVIFYLLNSFDLKVS